MADDPERTSAEREAARRDRESRRAQRAGRPAPYEQAAAEFTADPPVFDGPSTPPPPAAAPQSPVAKEPAAAPEPARESLAASEPAATPTDPEPLVESRDAPPRPIRSFPSPPDPEFYVSDDELEEAPSGTRRISRGARTDSAGGSGPGRGGGRRSRRPPAPLRRPPTATAHRPRRWWARAAALLMLLVAAAIVVLAIEVFQPFGTSPHGAVTVRIPQNTGSNDVSRLLARDGVVSSSTFFELRATLEGDRGRIRAGTYHLQKGMSYGAVLKRLTAVPKAAKTTQLTLAEGHTRQYVAALLSKQHVKGYLAHTVHSPVLNPRAYGAPKSTRNLEGFLFPDTFTLRDPVRASALVADQLKDFKRRFATVNLAQARRLHLSAFDVVKIASLIEAEAASPTDDRLVSSVIDNRLRDHMMLQLDSTARYATGNFLKPLTVSQLGSKSPYNTHTHFGLPPGPIDSPGLTALNAAAHPASSHYLYFFSKPCTNKTVFANSYAQFQILLVRDHRSHCPK